MYAESPSSSSSPSSPSPPLQATRLNDIIRAVSATKSFLNTVQLLSAFCHQKRGGRPCLAQLVYFHYQVEVVGATSGMRPAWGEDDYSYLDFVGLPPFIQRQF